MSSTRRNQSTTGTTTIKKAKKVKKAAAASSADAPPEATPEGSDDDTQVRSMNDFTSEVLSSIRFAPTSTINPRDATHEVVAGEIVADSPTSFIEDRINLLRKDRSPNVRLVEKCRSMAQAARNRILAKVNLSYELFQGYDWRNEPGDKLENLYNNGGLAEVLSKLTLPVIINESAELVDQILKMFATTCYTKLYGEYFMIYFASDLRVDKPKKEPKVYIRNGKTYAAGIRLRWNGLVLGKGIVIYDETLHAGVLEENIRTNPSSGEKYVIASDFRSKRYPDQVEIGEYLTRPNPFVFIPIKVGSKNCFYSENPMPENQLVGFYIIEGNVKDTSAGTKVSHLYVTTAVQIRLQEVISHFKIAGIDSTSYTFKGQRAHGRIVIYQNSRSFPKTKTIEDVSMNLMRILPNELPGEYLVQVFELMKAEPDIGSIPGRFNALIILAELYRRKEGKDKLVPCIKRVYLEILDHFDQEMKEQLGIPNEKWEIPGKDGLQITFRQAIKHALGGMNLGFYFAVESESPIPHRIMEIIREHYGILEEDNHTLFEAIIREMFSREGHFETTPGLYATRYNILLKMFVTHIAITNGLTPPPAEDNWVNKQVTPFESSGLLADMHVSLLRMQADLLLTPEQIEAEKKAKRKRKRTTIETLAQDVEKAFNSHILQTEEYSNQSGTNVLEASQLLEHPTQAYINDVSITIAAKVDPRSKAEEKRAHNPTGEIHVSRGGRKDLANSVGRRAKRSVLTHISRNRNYIIGADGRKQLLVDRIRQEMEIFKAQAREARTNVEFSEQTYAVIVNYVTIGHVYDIDGFEARLRYLKRRSELPFDIGIYQQKNLLRQEVQEYTLVISDTIGRLIFPFLLTNHSLTEGTPGTGTGVSGEGGAFGGGGVIPLCLPYIEKLRELYDQYQSPEVSRIFIARFLPEMLAAGMIEYLDVMEKEFQVQEGSGIAESFTSVDTITTPSKTDVPGKVLRNEQKYVPPGRFSHCHVFGSYNPIGQSLARGPYGLERHRQVLYGENPLTRTKPSDHRFLTAGHRPLQQLSGDIWRSGNVLPMTYNCTSVIMSSATMAEEARTYGPQINFARSILKSVEQSFSTITGPGEEVIQRTNNPESAGYSPQELAALTKDITEDQIELRTIKIKNLDVQVLVPKIGTRVTPGLKLIPCFTTANKNIKSGWASANSKVSGIVTHVTVSVGIPITKNSTSSLAISSIEAQVERQLSGTTGAKVTNEGGQKGMGGAPNSRIPHYKGSPIGEQVSTEVMIKRDTPSWARTQIINSLFVNSWTHGVHFYGMSMKNPMFLKELYRKLGYRPRVPLTDAKGRPVGIGSVGVDHNQIIYADETSFQTNPSITGSAVHRDPITGVPNAVSGSNTASISTQAIPYLPKDPNFMNILLTKENSDLMTYVHCRQCENIGYVVVHSDRCQVVCPTCTQTIVYDHINNHVISDTSSIGNFSAIKLRGAFRAAVQHLRIMYVDTKLSIEEIIPETLGRYID